LYVIALIINAMLLWTSLTLCRSMQIELSNLWHV